MTVVLSGGDLLSTGSSSSSVASSAAFPRGVTFYGGTAQDYAELYRRQPNVRLVVRFLGRNCAQLGLKAYVRKSESERMAIDPRHPLRAFLRSPTSISPVPVTRHRWVRALVEDLAIYDQALHVLMTNEVTGRISAVRIPPVNFVPMGRSPLWPDFFRVYGLARDWIDFPPDRVLYFSGHNPTDSRSGISPLEALRRVLAEDAAAGEYREQFWNGAARNPGYIQRPVEAPKWSTAAKDRFEEDFSAANSGTGPLAGRTPVLEEGMTFKTSGFSAKDSEYLSARILSRAECGAQYFISPVFLGILENANFSNVREFHRGLYSDTLGPWLDWITEDLEAQLLPHFEDVDEVYLDFNIAAKLEGSFEEQAAALSTLVGSPIMVRNEGRAKMNLPPIPGGDEIVTPLNVLVGGLASPRDTAPEPADATPAPGTMARHRIGPGKKSIELAPELVGWEAKHVEILTGFFTRQRDSVISKLGAGHELAAAFDSDRWNTELRNDLFGLALAMAEDVGGALAGEYGGELDVSRLEAYLETNARAAAEGVNAATFAALGEVWSGVPRTGAASRPSAKAHLTQVLADAGLVDEDADDDLPEDPFGDDFLAPAKNVFEVAIAARALQIATSRATTVGQFSRAEGATQAGRSTKTWVGSGAPNSRHADLDGETVPIGETFSNGAQWPGDPALGVDETAGCKCSLDFGT